jgi:hypothetical protein
MLATWLVRTDYYIRGARLAGSWRVDQLRCEPGIALGKGGVKEHSRA